MTGSKSPKPENVVFFHHPDAVDTSHDTMAAHHAAEVPFFRGFVRHSGVDTFYCQSLDAAHNQDFAARVKSFGALDRPIVLLSNPEKVKDPLFYDPDGPE